MDFGTLLIGMEDVRLLQETASQKEPVESKRLEWKSTGKFNSPSFPTII
ncbi:hypothetical protein [Niallia sp. NCCP-28]|nr:hypothetical protein [Niallia sp. NCCP-28]